MTAPLNQDLDVKYETSEALLNKQAEDGGSLQAERVLQEEKDREEVINQIRTVEQAEANNSARYIDFSTGEVIADDADGYEDGLSVAAILGLVERGMIGDDELAAYLDNAINSLASTAANDKVKAKKHLSHLLELLQVLEVNMATSQRNVELQKSLRNLQERLLAVHKNFNLEAVQNLLRTGELHARLQQSLKTAAIQPENLRIVATATRDLASDAQRIGREIALRQSIEARTKLQSVLKDSFAQIQQTYNAAREQARLETNPAKLSDNVQTLRTLAKQANEINQVNAQLKSADTTNIADQVRNAQIVVENLARQGLETQVPDLSKINNLIPLEKAIESQRNQLQAQQKIEQRPEADAKLKTLESIRNIAQESFRDNAKDPENVIRPDPKVFKDPIKEKAPIEKEKPEVEKKLKVEPKEKPGLKQKVEKDNIIRPDPEVFGDSPPSKPEKAHVCVGGCCDPKGVDPSSKPEGHVHGAGCGCGPTVATFETSADEIGTTVEPNSAGYAADIADFGEAVGF